MFKIAICDDEEILIRELRECLDRYSEETGREFCYFEYHDGTELLKNYQPDFFRGDKCACRAGAGMDGHGLAAQFCAVYAVRGSGIFKSRLRVSCGVHKQEYARYV